jgi:hypothetical protein
MLYATTYTFRGQVTEESQKRFMHLFSQWKLPKGVTWKAHYVNADGSGGIIISEAKSAEAMFESAAPWNPWLQLHTVPILTIDAAVPTIMSVYAWRDSVKK